MRGLSFVSCARASEQNTATAAWRDDLFAGTHTMTAASKQATHRDYLVSRTRMNLLSVLLIDLNAKVPNEHNSRLPHLLLNDEQR
jgi:hypothetical protein